MAADPFTYRRRCPGFQRERELFTCLRRRTDQHCLFLGRRGSLANWTATLVTEKKMLLEGKEQIFSRYEVEYAANCAIMAMRPPEIGSVGVPDAVREVNHDRLGFR